MSKDQTPVIYREFKEGGDLIALFPTLPGDSSPSTCLSYQTIGQHGAASVRLSRDRGTRAASVQDPRVQALHAELTRIGYNLRPVARISERMDRARFAALSR